VLVLNRVFTPIHVASVKRALVLLYSDAAKAIDHDGNDYDFQQWRSQPINENDETLPIVGGALKVPRIIQLARYDRHPRTAVRLTRQNLMLRDDYQCQYCGKKPALRELNIDHVVARCRGGQDTWENLVTACKPCNIRKGWRTPEEANMRLSRRPVRPSWSMATQILMRSHAPYREWEPFLVAG